MGVVVFFPSSHLAQNERILKYPREGEGLPDCLGIQVDIKTRGLPNILEVGCLKNIQ